jgi:inward rectifier potassium channel
LARNLRSGDLIKVQVVGHATPLHEDLYHRVLVMPWGWFFVCAALLFLGENALFAGLYLLQPGCIAGAEPGSFADAFFFSVQTLGTIGYGVFAPRTWYAQAVVTMEALSGMLSLAIATGLTFAKFSRPTARLLFTSRAVIGTRNGKRCLMFRMANARNNTITEASLRVMVLRDEVTAEGERMRVPVRVRLLRDTHYFFRLTWTAFHEIDEDSLFFGPDALEKLRAQNALIMLSLSGLDETLSQTVQARYMYAVDDVVVGARFADVLTLAPDGTRVLDYSAFHDVVMEADGRVSRGEGEA